MKSRRWRLFMFCGTMSHRMSPQKRKARSLRVRKMNAILRKLYPEARIALQYGNPWELLVAVQLSAQCTDARVNMVTAKLFKKYRTIRDYASARQSDFEKDIYSCGFYRNKAKNIIGAAKVISARHGGEVPASMGELLGLPGVARKTANVVLSNLYEKAEGIAVDTHVRRFAIRFDLSDYTDPVRIERDLMTIMPKREWWGFNHRLVHYGRDICPARRHDCASHPLTKIYSKAATVWPKSR
jgi:endonuclease III